ncbi:PLP-dependent aminotransferase family protein [Aestuariibius sp. HNIBRBA575]|uniref:MocR-like pyridoxine biosynthesis transcription factor PdxR n=1 Tax=Aestuariibius sp. HNIBRBA575 TaxID=3233343 RepID=UPI0034A4CEE3
MAISVNTFFLSPDSEHTLQSQIRQIVAEGVLSGRFQSKEKLPSSRALARHLGVSRITVTLAYTELQADNYITSMGRSGYYVSDNAPEPPSFPARAPGKGNVDWTRVLGHRPTPYWLQKPADWATYKYQFIYGQMDPELFDSANWRLCALQALGRKDFKSLSADHFDADDPNLVEFITRQTLPRRGILASSDEVLITMGAQNALWLTVQVLLNQRRRAAIETPGYPSLRDILHGSRCHVSHVPVDDDGLPPDLIPDDTDVVFTTPAHQCPTTATMPLSRRKELLEKAERDDFLIVEDDYEFEMAFLKPASAALKSLDEGGRVIYVGSFSKSLFPGLRLGYLVGPAPFIREARALRASVLRHPPGLLQRTTSYFLSLGHYDALIKRMQTAYHDRRRVMDQAIGELGLTVAGEGSYGGSSLWMRAEGVNMDEAAEKLRSQSVLIEPGAPFFAGDTPPTDFYRLAYSSIPQTKIHDGLSLISQTLNRG